MAMLRLPPRFRPFVLPAVIFAVVAALAAWSPAWQAMDRRAFDALTVATAPHRANQPIMLVAIDEESMRAIGRQWPWPRGMHADLIDRMANAGAIAIALDLLLAEPSDPAEDAKLAAAIRRAGNVVLASDFVYSETAAARIWRRTDPYEAFVAAGARPGLASIPIDSDTFARRIPGEPDAFWRQVVLLAQSRVPTLRIPPQPQGGELIRYHGGDEVYDAIPYHMVLAATPEELAQVFRDRIVIVGRDVRANPEIGRSQPDLFATPFLESTGALTSGMRVHAAIVENALTGDAIHEAPRGSLPLIELLTAALAMFAFRRWTPVRKGLLLVTLVAATAGLTAAAYVYGNLWLPLTGAAAILLTAYLAYGAQAYLAESRRKREIERAFGMYLSPHVVARIAEDPAVLGLSGERREITIMFTDLAGFTSYSEAHAPEEVASLLMRYFTAMTDIVLARRGTVVQFMGDGMMAFWGAPLDDPDHPLHAVQAAIGMQEAIRQFPELKMRIGINTASAVVGNLGSAHRLAYGAMGDGVNLASRLEGANKAYGTRVLLSQSTAERVMADVPLKLVERLRVSGKQNAVDVYTPIALVDIPALDARISETRRNRVGADGSVALEKL
jgi:adenylate cyclase